MEKLYAKVEPAATPSSEEFLSTLSCGTARKIGEVLQAVSEAEVDEFLRCLRGERSGGGLGFRDGHEDERTITYGSHPIRVRRPRVRQSEERFRSKVLPPYRRRFEGVDQTLHELWIQGLSTRDFELSLRALPGERRRSRLRPSRS